MSKTIQEQIEVMQHYANGEKVQFKPTDLDWINCNNPDWNWANYDYRIKEQKKTIAIEKWLCVFDDGEYRIVETSDADLLVSGKVKLLETYEVEL